MDGSDRTTTTSTNGNETNTANFGNRNELFRRIDSKSPPTFPTDVLPSFISPGANQGSIANPKTNPAAKPGALPRAGSAFPKLGSRPTTEIQSVPPPLMAPVRPAEVKPSLPPLTTGRAPETQIAQPKLTPERAPQQVPREQQQQVPREQQPRPITADSRLIKPPEQRQPQQRPPEQQQPQRPSDQQRPPVQQNTQEKAWRFNQDTAPKQENRARNEWMVRQMDKLLSMGVGELKFDAIPANAEPRFWKDEQGHFLYFKNFGDPNKRYHLSNALNTIEMGGKKFDLKAIRADIDDQLYKKWEAATAADDSPNNKWSFQSKKLDGNTEVVSVYDSNQRMRFQQTFKGGSLAAVVELDPAQKPQVKMSFSANGLAKIEIREGDTWQKFQKRGDNWQPADSHNGRKLESYVKPHYTRKPG